MDLGMNPEQEQLRNAAQNNLAFNCSSAAQFMEPAEKRMQQLIEQGEEEEIGNLNNQMDIDEDMPPGEYVNRVIEKAEDLFK